MSERDNRLKQFFAGYFNQDWDIHGAVDWSGVIDEYLSQNSRNDAAQIQNDLRSWLFETEQNKNLPVAFGCDYDPNPDGMDQRTWLAAMADYIESKIEKAGHDT